LLAGQLSLLAGALLGLALLTLTGQLWIAVIASPLVAVGYLYNAGKRPLSYTRLGEWVTGLCYGPGVFGCLWLLTGLPVDSAAVAGMLAFGALAMALLLSHQPPQIETDRAAGKLSFAVRHGAIITRRSAQTLMLLFVASFGFSLWVYSDTLAVPVGFALTAVALTLVSPLPSPPTILRVASLGLLTGVGFQLATPGLGYYFSFL
jgi:1,4-dihydroxy-2-naphthoate octaprenyltransferase